MHLILHWRLLATTSCSLFYCAYVLWALDFICLLAIDGRGWWRGCYCFEISRLEGWRWWREKGTTFQSNSATWYLRGTDVWTDGSILRAKGLTIYITKRLNCYSICLHTKKLIEYNNTESLTHRLSALKWIEFTSISRDNFLSFFFISFFFVKIRR